MLEGCLSPVYMFREGFLQYLGRGSSNQGGVSEWGLATASTCCRRRMRMARSVDENIFTTTGMIFC